MNTTTLEQSIDRDGLRSHNRLMLAIVAGPFVGNLIMLAPPPFFPLISRELGISVPLLGQAMTGMLLLSAALALVAGPLADRYGHRRIMLVGACAAVCSLIGFGLANSYAVLIMAGLIGGLATATLPSISVAVASSCFEGLERRRALGWASSAGAGSAVIGVPLLVAIADVTNWRVSLTLGGALTIAAVWLIATHVPGVSRREEESVTFTVFRKAYRPLLRHAQSVRLLGATVLRTVCWSGYLTYLSALMHQQLGMSTGQIGVMFFVGGSAYILASLNTRRVLGWLPLRPTVAAANAGMALLVAFVLTGVAGYWVTITLIPLTGIAAGIGWVSIVTLMAEESPAGSGTTMALNGSAFNLGAAGGGALGGLVLATAGFPAMGVLLGTFAIAGAVLAGIPSRRVTVQRPA